MPAAFLTSIAWPHLSWIDQWLYAAAELSPFAPQKKRSGRHFRGAKCRAIVPIAMREGTIGTIVLHSFTTSERKATRMNRPLLPGQRRQKTHPTICMSGAGRGNPCKNFGKFGNSHCVSRPVLPAPSATRAIETQPAWRGADQPRAV